MANYFRRLILNKNVLEAVALAIIGIILITFTYFLIGFVISHMPAPFGSFEELMKP